MSKFNFFIFLCLVILTGCKQNEQPTIDAFSLIQVENFDGETGKVDNGNYNGISRFDKITTYSVVRSFDTGDVLLFENVDFKDGAQSVTLNIAQNWGEPDGSAKIEFRLDRPDGKLIGTHEVQETAGWEHYMFQTRNISKVTGIHDLYVAADHLRGAGDIDWITFSKYKVPISSLAPTLQVDSTSYHSKNGMRYYIDSENGHDNNSGRSPENAWKSHTKISTKTFQPGDVIAFKKGSQFTGPMVISDSGTQSDPILITSYGKGQKPRFTNPDDSNMNGNCLRIKGSWITVENLHFHDTPGTKNNNRLKSIFKMGAILNAEGANHNIIRNNDFTDVTKGIQSTGEYTLITGNYIEGVPNSLWWNGGFGSWGPMGIQLGIGNQEVSYNIIKNFLSTESGYGSDGGAIELDDGRFHKKNVYIHHNYSEGNAGFLESSWTHDNNPFVQEVYNLRVAFNVSYDGQSWIFMWAPCHDCYFDNNTVIRSNDFRSPLYNDVLADFEGINFRNNLFVSRYDVFQGNTSQNISNNWYLNFNRPNKVLFDSLQAGNGDPGLVNLIGGDFNLTSESPLRGKAENLSEFYQVDFNGKELPRSGHWDVGAIQFKQLDRHTIHRKNSQEAFMQDVSGMQPSDSSQTWLSHEHILVDFIGADSIQPNGWNHDSIIEEITPFFEELKEFNVNYFVDATPNYLGRDVVLLEKIAAETGIKILTNTGLYGARNDKFIPQFAQEMTAENLAKLWIDESKNGIAGTSIKPGFIKIGIDRKDPLSDMHQKLVRAAALTHLETGLTIASHTGKATGLWPQLNILKEMDVSPESFIWVHAQSENNTDNYLKAAAIGCWISLDGLGRDLDKHVEKILFAKRNGILDRILISHDSGWYDPQKEIQAIRPYTNIFKKLYPALRSQGFTDDEFNLLMRVNPSKAFSIEIRNYPSDKNDH